MNGRAKVMSSMVNGCGAVPIEVEACVADGLDSMVILGLPDAAVCEARERVRCALRSSGFALPRGKVVVSLSPAAVRKSGTGFDLAIAAAILASTGQISRTWAEGRAFVGELALDGRVRPARGMFCHARAAHEAGLGLVCSKEAREAALSRAVRALGLGGLGELRDPEGIDPLAAAELEAASPLDFSDVPGHLAAKRAMQVAVAGRHGILMVGPEGSYAPLLAARMTSVMPPMDDAEAVESALALSAAGVDPSPALADARPFRAPHCSVTVPGLLGGGWPVVPGEAALAHAGVLFLERIEGFGPSALQSLRPVTDEGAVRIARAWGTTVMPARFQLAASTAPCPCGRFGDPSGECTCSVAQIARHQSRLCGPLADRFEVRADLPSASAERGSLAGGSDHYLGPVWEAWERRAWREERGADVRDPRAVLHACMLSEADERWLERASAAAGISGRAIAAAARVARTIADMDGRDAVGRDDLAEAISLRVSR